MASAPAPTRERNGNAAADPNKKAIALLDREFQFVPFLAKDAITLTARTVVQFLCKPTKSGKVCTQEQALRFCMLCKARGLNPWEGDAFLVGFDTKEGPEFNLITAHQAFLKRAEVHPEYDGMRSGVIVQRGKETVELEGDFFERGDTLLGGWATVYMKNRSHPMTKRLRLEPFNKGFGRWQNDAGGMIVKCSEADALRSAFPNSLGGMYLDEETPAERPERGPVRVLGSKADALADQLGDMPAADVPNDDDSAADGYARQIANATTRDQTEGIRYELERGEHGLEPSAVAGLYAALVEKEEQIGGI